jgi:catechol 2,3-dioxygenase-like lactoylglutathione lyase family enzyme
VLDHITIRTSDRAASERFYDTVLGIGIERSGRDEDYTVWQGPHSRQAAGSTGCTGAMGRVSRSASS